MIKKADKIITFDNKYNDAKSATLAIVEKNGKKVNVLKPTFDYGRREMFAPSEYNLTEIGVIEDVESYVRQSFQKKTALMFKEGEEFGGKNTQTINYIKKRIQQIEHVSGISWRSLLRDTGYALISRANYFWVKVRKQAASGGRTIAGIQPVAAYFGMGAENVEIKKNKQGKIVKYRQKMPDGRYRDFSPKDVIHFHAYKKSGFSFGTPQIVPVKEDIRALRRIEENVELLIYQTLFPIFQYKVGTESRPASDIRLPDGSLVSEVDYVRNQIYDMPAEGGIVTPERHEIKFIGAEGKALKVREYLDYFKNRVLSGLGISGVDIGEGNTANRATADSLSRGMVDSVKDLQNIIEETINKEVIKELLIESTFRFDVLAAENIVDFKFKEIDTEEQLKKNTNAQVLYNGNIIDINETRKIAGYEPITKAQESLMFNERVEMKRMAQMSIEKSKTDKAAKSAKNSNQPTNQHGKKTGPQKSRLDAYMIDKYINNVTRMLKHDIKKHIVNEEIDRYWINTIISLGKKTILDKYTKIVEIEYEKGIKYSGLDDTSSYLVPLGLQEVKDTLNQYVEKYIKDINGKVQNAITKMTDEGKSKKEIGEEISNVIDKIKYRGDFIDNTERIRAFNYGKAIGLKLKGFSKAEIIQNSDNDDEVKYINLNSLDIFSVPPYHPNSKALVGNGVE